MKGFERLSRILVPAELKDFWRLLGLASLVGVLAGLGAIAFYLMLDGARYLFLEKLAGYHPGHPVGEPPLFGPSAVELRSGVLFLLPALGGLISGLIVYYFAPEAEGHGTDAAIDAFHNRAGRIRGRVPLVKALASALTMGTGGSAGREGPIAQIGAGLGSQVAQWFGLKPAERRILLVAGMSAGVGAIFRAPLAGALFGAEVLYCKLDLEYEAIVPSVVSSIVAYAIFAVKFGWEPLFANPGFIFKNPLELAPYLALALLLAAGAVAYVRVFYAVRDFFRGLRIPRPLKPVLGGLGVGAIALVLPQAIGTGYGFCQKAIYGEPAAWLLLAVGAVKILATSLTIGSGGSGGVFGPAVVIGASLGGGAGKLLAGLFPALDLQPGAFALVGMAGFFSAAANTPLSTIIMVSEMTGNYHLLVPSMWVCFLAWLLTQKYSIYEKQIPSRLQSVVHLPELMEAALEKISVAEVLELEKRPPVPQVRPSAGLKELIELFENTPYSCFPVVGDDGLVVGQVSGHELRRLVGREELGQLVVAADLLHPLVAVAPQESLLEAVRRLEKSGEEEIVVIESAHHQKALALLSRSDVISGYTRKMAEKAER